MKDAKGHGSNPRGGNSVDMVFSSKAGVGGLGKGMYARLASGEQVKLNPAATEGRIPSVGSMIDPSQHTIVRIAAQHGIPTEHLASGGKFGPFASAVSGFREKYGAPRNLKAEARGFASGRREINRLKRQGK